MSNAPRNLKFEVFKTDAKKAEIGNPWGCIIALGIMREDDVVEAWVGSGKMAVVVYQDDGGKPYAHYYTLNAHAAEVRDTFEQNLKVDSKILSLRRPTVGRTLEHLAKLNKDRARRIKAGAPVKHRDKANVTRMMRIGVPHRPRAVIEKGVMTGPEKIAA